jgi:hypothetical protein
MVIPSEEDPIDDFSLCPNTSSAPRIQKFIKSTGAKVFIYSFCMIGYIVGIISLVRLICLCGHRRKRGEIPDGCCFCCCPLGLIKRR